MKQLVLLVYLRNDHANTLEKRIEYMNRAGDFPYLEGRDGVCLLSDNAILFDETKCHDALIQLCSALHGTAREPIRLSSVDGWIASGQLTKEVLSALQNLGVPCVP